MAIAVCMANTDVTMPRPDQCRRSPKRALGDNVGIWLGRIHRARSGEHSACCLHPVGEHAPSVGHDQDIGRRARVFRTDADAFQHFHHELVQIAGAHTPPVSCTSAMNANLPACCLSACRRTYAIDNVRQRLAANGQGCGLGHRVAQPTDSRHTGRSNVSREHHVFQSAERVTGWNRLGIRDVQAGAVQSPALQSLDQCRRINQIAARHID